jgi:membrane-associated protease RseP (regulator of RpoE activity)
LSSKSLALRATIYAAGPIFSLVVALAIYLTALTASGEATVFKIEIDRPEMVAAALLCGFSILVAGFQLIPIPPLDGGWLALIGIEAVTGRQISKRSLQSFGYIGWSLLIAGEIAAGGYFIALSNLK